jgi:hypothetical protein
MGGRPELLAQQFQHVLCHKLHVWFVPNESTAEKGEIYIASFNDIGLPTDQYGASFYQHLTQLEDVVVNTIWRPSSLEVAPERTMVAYEDNESGDFRMEVQGIVMCGAATSMDFGSAEIQTLGTLMCEWDFEFSQPILDQEVPLALSGNLTLEYGALSTWLPTAGEPVVIRVGVDDSTGLYLATADLPDGITVPNISDYLAYGVIEEGDAGFTASGLSYATRSDPTARPLVDATSGLSGRAIYIRFVGDDYLNGDATDAFGYVFADLASAKAPLSSIYPAGTALNDGMWYCATDWTHPSPSGTLTLSLRWMSLGEESA